MSLRATVAHRLRHRLLKFTSTGIWSLAFLIFVPLSAVTAASGVVEGFYYSAAEPIQAGMFVSLTSKESNQVELTTKENAASALGIATQEEAGLLTLAEKDSNTYVATSGSLQVYVSDLGGPVKSGDYLAISSVAGILKKAGTADAQILAVANEDLSIFSPTTREVTLQDGKRAKISLMSVHVKVFANPDKLQSSLFVDLGSQIVDKPVTLAQVVFAGVFFVAALVTVLTLMGSAVRAAITALGRNPLAKHSVLKSLLQLVILSALVLLVGTAGTYLILWI